ncbi:hypothetical protein ACH5RR_028739 [Cinchona calisaya]|uniref:Uncharacterized protein n=1 Tax=Cinchona calisaya TaxID=153742 RepID=A0ABD2YPN4_9GENT
MYKVEVLNQYEAIHLFSWNAFKKNYPAKDYEELSIEIVRYAGFLPLALKVLGSFLYGRNMAEWRSELERLKKIPEDEIMEKLEVSFNGLKQIEKQIFLDIACFFKGKKKDYIARVLDSFNFYPDIGIRVLIEKSLVTVSRGRILMHPLIQEMGWHIVRQKAPEEPGKHSRLWVEEEICHVLARDKVTENVEGLWLVLSTPKDLVIKNEAFEKMNKLRLLKIHNACVSRGPTCIPEEIRWLNWHGYPSKSLPDSFQAEKLVGLKLQYSRVIQLWKGIKVLDKLKFINLSHSQKLIRTPDFRGIPNLERLILEDCSSLIEVHHSAGHLKSLRLLNLNNCTNLRSLPKQILLERLEVMILSGCSKVVEFPEILGTMNCLREVYLEATSIKELPPSIEHLLGLVLLNLSYCKNLTRLPSSICRLKCLKSLFLSGCSMLSKLPEELGHLESLEELYGDETAISKPPSSVVLLKSLKTLSFRGCKGMASRTWSTLFSSWMLREECQDSMGFVIQSISGINSLAKLDLSDCNMLDGGFPCDLGSLSSLVELNHGRNNFTSISAARIKDLSCLRIIELVGCNKLEILPELPQGIQEVYADNCTSLHSVADLPTQYEKLYRLSFTNCFQLLRDQQTVSSMIDATWKQLLKGKKSNYMASIGSIGSEKNIDSEHTCLAYVPFAQFWWAFEKRLRSPNDWTRIEVSADDLSKKYMVFKAWGIDLVYEKDVKLNVIQQTSELGKMGASLDVLLLLSCAADCKCQGHGTKPGSWHGVIHLFWQISVVHCLLLLPLGESAYLLRIGMKKQRVFQGPLSKNAGSA